MIGTLLIMGTALAGGRYVMTRAKRAAAAKRAHTEWKRYHREGGAVRHRRTWGRCPLCGFGCVKPGVPSHGSIVGVRQ